jgi:hypothetical protein
MKNMSTHLSLKIVVFTFLLTAILQPFNINAQSVGWQWVRGNTGGGNDAWAIAADPYSNIFVSGITLGGGPNVFSGHTIPQIGVTSYQVVLVKYDSSGNYRWGIGTQRGSAWLINIAADIFGNSFLYGIMQSDSLQIDTVVLHKKAGAVNPYFLVKFDSSGRVKWAVTDGEGLNSYYFGFAYVLGAGGITADDSGNVYISENFNTSSMSIGSHTFTNHGAAGTTDVYVAKYDSVGHVKWATSVGDSSDDVAVGITATVQGNVYVGGITKSKQLSFGTTTITNSLGSGSQIAYIGRFNSSGQPVWGAGWGGILQTYACGLASYLDSGIYIIGAFKDSSIIVAGDTINNPAPGTSSAYLIRFDSSNKVVWHKVIYGIGTGSALGYSVATSLCGTVWVSGNMTASGINIDGNILSAPSGGSDPIFVAGYSDTGAVINYSALSSGADDQVGMTCDFYGNVYICADYFGGTFKVGSTTFPAPTGGENLYVAKFADTTCKPFIDTTHGDTTAVRMLSGNSPNITIAPNPAFNNVEITIRDFSTNSPFFYRLSDFTGRVLSYGKIPFAKQQINISGLNPGIYFIEVYNDSGRIIRKLIKE